MEQIFDLETLAFGPKALDIPEDLQDQFRALMTPYFETAMANIEGEIVARVPFGATGDLGRSIHGTMVPQVVDIAGVIRAEGSAAAYAPFVEFGRGPGKPPPFDKEGYNGNPGIFPWVEHIYTAGENAKTGKTVAAGASRDKQVESLGFVIARAIGAHGVKGRHPFEEGWEAAQPMAIVILTDGVAKTLQALGLQGGHA